MDLDFLAWIAFFAAIAAICIAAMVLRTRFRLRMLDVVQSASASGQPLTPETIREMGFRRRNDLRTGIILVAVWAASLVMAIGMGADRRGFDPEEFLQFVGLGCFPGFIGLALIALHVFRKDDR